MGAGSSYSGHARGTCVDSPNAPSLRVLHDEEETWMAMVKVSCTFPGDTDHHPQARTIPNSTPTTKSQRDMQIMIATMVMYSDLLVRWRVSQTASLMRSMPRTKMSAPTTIIAAMTK